MTKDVSATLAERGGRYGAFIDHATIAQGIQAVLFAAPNWSKLDPDMRQALCVISDKMARILNGDPYYDDNWHDIQGYAKLVETRIKALQEQKEVKYEGVAQMPPTNAHDDTWQPICEKPGRPSDEAISFPKDDDPLRGYGGHYGY